jgi:hypothetical protein
MTSAHTDTRDAGLDELGFMHWLKANHYTHLKPLPGGRWAGLLRLMFTHAIVTGQLGDVYGYEDRWCYKSLEEAAAALELWNGVGEPRGWHRHPGSGRRRVDGDPAQETIAW